MVGTTGISTNVTVRRVTSHQNCFSGLLMTGVSDSVIEDNSIGGNISGLLVQANADHPAKRHSRQSAEPGFSQCWRSDRR
jgi:hypothetical protein